MLALKVSEMVFIGIDHTGMMHDVKIVPDVELKGGTMIHITP